VSDLNPAPRTHTEVTTRETIVGGVTTSLKRLDPNMLAVLMLVIVMNGLFFWIYAELAKMRHVEFIAALNSCPANPGVTAQGMAIPRSSFPGGIDR
jgi:hypothetical protein